MKSAKYLSVTALTKYIKYKFDNDTHLRNILLKGEISNFKHHSRGHFYFTLKDEFSQISAIMFVSSAKSVKFIPKDGMNVLVEGHITVYEANGGYQIYVQKMTEDGIGDLYLAYEQLKEKLSKKGMFSEIYKKPLPKFPKKVGVITSPTGAAVRDIINIINRRYPICEIIVYPTLVQGEFAKNSIVDSINKANIDHLVDVIIMGRGGGSIEDLWGFNEEIVADAIFNSKIPIVSAVGHEIDFTISDFVSDKRAPTPSGAAEIVVPDWRTLYEYIDTIKKRILYSFENKISNLDDSLARIKSSYVFTKPTRLFENYNLKLIHLQDKLEQVSPVKILENNRERLFNIHSLLDRNYINYIEKKNNNYNNLIDKLNLLNPLNIMKKGYSVAKIDNKVINTIEDVNRDDLINITVNDGLIDCKVLSKRKDDFSE